MPDAGDVIVVDFPGATGQKRRPAVVLSSSAYHGARPDAILGLVTSQTANATGATDYILQDWRQAGLRLPSAFREFLVTLPRSSLSAKIGSLSTDDLDAVRKRVKTALLDLSVTRSPNSLE